MSVELAKERQQLKLLREIAQRMRAEVEIRDRQYHLRLYKNSFVAAEAVDWMLKTGVVKKRDAAVQVGKELVRRKFIHHVVDAHNFEDTYLFFRFYTDEEAHPHRWWRKSVLGRDGRKLSTASVTGSGAIPDVSPSRSRLGALHTAGSGRRASSDVGGLTWRFQAHTKANSIVLTIPIAESIESAMEARDPQGTAAAVGELRKRVLTEASPKAKGWVASASRTEKGVVDVYRKHFDGAFQTLKSVGLIKCDGGAKKLLAKLVDFDSRKRYEPFFDLGFEVEAVNGMEWSDARSHMGTVGEGDEGEEEADSDGAAGEAGGPAGPGGSSSDVAATAASEASTSASTGSGSGGGGDATASTPGAGADAGTASSESESASASVAGSGTPPAPPPAAPAAGDATSAASAGGGAATAPGLPAPASSSSSPDAGAAATGGDATGRTPSGRKASGRARSGRTTSADSALGLPRIDTAGDIVESDSDEELLHEKFAKLVNKSKRLSKVFGRILGTTPKVPETPELDEVAIRDLRSPSMASRDEASMAAAAAAASSGGGGDALDSTSSRADSDGPGGLGAGGAASLLECGLEPGQCCSRVIYRRSGPVGSLLSPRDACAFQDWFVTDDGTYCVYEVSVQHKLVPPAPKIARGELLCFAHVIEPTEQAGWFRVTVVAQYDPHGRSPPFFRPLYADYHSTLIMEKLRDATGTNSGQLDEVTALLGDLPMDGDDGDADGSATPGTDASLSSRSKGIGLDSFDLLAVLGRGGYGKVMMVRKKDSGHVYALKVLRKKDIAARKQVKRTMTERDILCSIDHPFIVGLRYAFQSPSKLYMVIDFVSGGDFFTLLSREGTVGERRAKLYMAQLVLALSHLHGQGIVYRDLKPENVLLDGEGNVKLTDFGLSRFFEKRKSPGAALIASSGVEAAAGAAAGVAGAGAGAGAGAAGGEEAKGTEDADAASGSGGAAARSAASAAAGAAASEADARAAFSGALPEVDPANMVTHSFCGTEQYMAPEVLLQRGHGNAVDYWCLGILFSEMLTGRHPFRGPNHFATLKNIVNPNVRPATLSSVSPAAASLMSGLLRRNVKTRLGTEEAGGVESVKSHPFFAGLDWDAVLSRRVKPEYKPRVRAGDDASNFDRVFTREAPVDSVADEPDAAADDANGGGFFGFFRSKKKASDKEADSRADANFRGFSFAAPSVAGRSAAATALIEETGAEADDFAGWDAAVAAER